MKRIPATLAALGLGVASLTSTAATAQAATACTITNFSPRSVTVGLTPVVVTFRPPTVTGCTLQDWNIQGDSFFVYKGSPQEVFRPYSNADTKPQDVVVEASNPDYETRSRVFADSFTIKRNTGWDQFNASPEPVARGSKITIKGRLRIVDWENDRYNAFTNRTVAVDFRTSTGTYHQVRTATTGSGGYVTTTVTANEDGIWRLRYAGNTTYGASQPVGDFVDVR